MSLLPGSIFPREKTWKPPLLPKSHHPLTALSKQFASLFHRRTGIWLRDREGSVQAQDTLLSPPAIYSTAASASYPWRQIIRAASSASNFAKGAKQSEPGRWQRQDPREHSADLAPEREESELRTLPKANPSMTSKVPSLALWMPCHGGCCLGCAATRNSCSLRGYLHGPCSV